MESLYSEGSSAGVRRKHAPQTIAVQLEDVSLRAPSFPSPLSVQERKQHPHLASEEMTCGLETGPFDKLAQFSTIPETCLGRSDPNLSLAQVLADGDILRDDNSPCGKSQEYDLAKYSWVMTRLEPATKALAALIVVCLIARPRICTGRYLLQVCHLNSTSKAGCRLQQ